MKKILKKLFQTLMIGIIFCSNISFANNTSSKDNCFETNGATDIELIVEDNKVEANKDLILYIYTNKSIKGREIQLKEKDTIRGGEKEVVYHNKEEEYCYKYTYLTYSDTKINNITITKLPNENINIYVYIKYNGKYYYLNSIKNKKNNESLKQSTDTTLIPQKYINEKELEKLKVKDTTIMKKKWADKLNIDVDEVDNYLDLYNAKGQGKLHKDGRKIKNDKNEEVMLNGVGLFHIVDYGYMYNEKTLNALKYWGINCIRIPAYINYRVSSNDGDVTRDERGLVTSYDEHIKAMDEIIDIATKEGLYCIIDFHILSSDGNISQYQEIGNKFFEHFSSKYGKQNNILYEFANEPYGGTSLESLIEFANTEKQIIKKYDENPIMICGIFHNVPKLTEYYQEFKNKNMDDIFLSIHYYDGESLNIVTDAYEKSDIPLIWTEWGNADSDSNAETSIYTDVTKQYLKWWNDNNILNCAWMLCGGNYKYSLWTHELGDKAIAVQNGCISDEYLSEYGKLVFQTYFDNNIERVKKNEIYINRDLNKKDYTKDKEKNDTNENKINYSNVIKENDVIANDSSGDNTIKNGKLPNAGQKTVYLTLTILMLLCSIVIVGIKLYSYKKI